MSEQNSNRSERNAQHRTSTGRDGQKRYGKTNGGKSFGAAKGKGGYKGKRSADGDSKSGYKGKRSFGDSESKGGYKGKRSFADGDSKDKKPFKSQSRGNSFKSGKPGDKKFDKKPRSEEHEGASFEKRDGENRDRKRTFNKDGAKKNFGRDGKSFNKRSGKSFDKSFDNRSNKKYDKPRDTKPVENVDEEQSNEKRWTPNKERRVRSKKAFDQQNLKTLVNSEASIYRGELDPMRGERSPIARGRNTRDIQFAAEEREREQKQLEREERLARDNENLPLSEKFEPSNASLARLAALDVTRMVRRRNAYAQDLIESRIDNSDLTKSDKAFATLLILGVVSTYGTLDEIINKGLKKADDITREVRDALRISTYEIIFLDKSPHAAVDQGVELVKAIVPSASGLANAVLHRVLNMKEEFPFGNPATELDALARMYAFPKWMARMLIEDLGAQAAADLMRVSNDPAPLFIHVNSAKATDEEITAAFEDAGATLKPAEADGITPAGCYHVSNPRVLANSAIAALFADGKILVSDASAQVVAESLLPEVKPQSFLEIGAGRGTKTIMLQSYALRKYGSQMNMTSLDTHEFKMNLLEDRAKQYGIELDRTVTGNAMRMETLLPGEQFDAVFIDAPCSGLGTLRRHQEIRWRINSNHIEELAETGFNILKSAASCVAPGGELVYATCTVTYAENNGVVKRFLESSEGADFSLAPIQGRPCIASKITSGSADAHFCVRFVRKEN